jgi:NodT family efflux transporter outer membrane factor (OMF) lipoprotein
MKPGVFGVLGTLVGGSLLGGCLVGPDYVRPAPATTPPAFKEMRSQPAATAVLPGVPIRGEWRPASPQDMADRGAWWSIYNDPLLYSLVSQVEVSNQTLKSAEAAYRQSRALIRENRSTLYPTVSASGGPTQIGTGQSRSSSGNSSGNATQFAGTGSLSWEIDIWGGIRRTIENASAAAQASAADLAAARLSIQAEVITDYFSLRVADESRRLFEASVAAYQRSLQIVQNQVNAGIASNLDLAQARTLVQQTQAQVVAATLQRTLFEHAIAALIGKAPAELTIAPSKLSETVPFLDAGIPSTLLERRPDIAAAERQMAAANAQIGVAVAAYYPNLTLSGSLGFLSNTIGTLFAVGNSVWSLGPQLAGTVIDGGARGGAVDSARAAYDAAVANYRQTVLTAFQDVEDQLANQRILTQQEVVQLQAVASAREAVQLSLNQYLAGTVPYTTVVVTQTTALSNEQSALTVRLNRLTASANLIKALGGGWNTTQLPAPEPIAGLTQR